MDSLFWSIATSHLALMAIAGVLLAALVVGYVPLLKFVPVIGPYVRVAKLVAFLTFGLLCALLDRRSADMRAEIAQLRINLAFADVQLENQKATADHASRLARASEESAIAIQSKVTAYEKRLASHPVGACALDDDDVGSLLAIRPRRAGKYVDPNPARLRVFGPRRSDPGS